MTVDVEKFDRCVRVNPPLDDTCLGELPATRGVVLLSSTCGVPVLLMTAANIRSRVAVRLCRTEDQKLRKTADLRQTVGQICWKSAPTAMACDLAFIEIAAMTWDGGGEYLKSLRPPWCVAMENRKGRCELVVRKWSGNFSSMTLGPFPTAKSAEKISGILCDAFGLCRDHRRLAAAPNASRCAYGQMGKCLCPCDGSISIESYNSAVSSAVSLLSSGRDSALAALDAEIKLASGQLRFEDAGMLNARRRRLEELRHGDFDFFGNASKFAMMIVMRVPLRKRVQIFYCRGGEVGGGEVLPFSADEAVVERVIKSMNEFSTDGSSPLANWKMSLLCRYMWSGRGGVFLPATGLNVASVRRAMDNLQSAGGEKDDANLESAMEHCSVPEDMEL